MSKLILSVDEWKESYRKRHKFNAQRTVIDNISFDSKKEADRYRDLLTLVSIKEIRHLQLQRTFEFYTGPIKVERWRIDFCYKEKIDGAWVRIAEDTTGYLTTRKKRLIKLFGDQYGVGNPNPFEQWVLRIT